MKGFANQVEVQPKKKKSERGTKENFKRFDETSSKREFPSAPSLLLVQIFMDTPQKAAACPIDKQRQVKCLISPVIITMLLIDTGLSPTTAGETLFDLRLLSPGAALVSPPSPSPGPKTNIQDRFWVRVCWVFPSLHSRCLLPANI